MKKFKVEITMSESYTTAIWDGDTFPDVIEADSEEEAIEFAKDAMKDNDWFRESGDSVDNYLWRATEVVDE